MGLFGLFGKKNRVSVPAEKAEEGPFLEDYAGMEAAVTDTEGRLLFTAKLLGLEENRGNLHQLSDASISRELDGPLPVQLRGYSLRKSKAAYLEGTISPAADEGVWRIENLALVKLENDRAYFRMAVDMPAAVTAVGRPGAKEEPCRLVDLSVGGVRIASSVPHQVEERLLLSADLLPGKPPSTMLCQILRVIAQDHDYEYGCRFIELGDADEDRIVQLIFALQRRKSGRF